MEKNEILQFDLTTKTGIDETNNWMKTFGAIMFPQYFLISKIFNTFKKTISTEEQIKTVENLIETGKKNGVKNMKIKVEKNASINLGADIQGVPIQLKTGIDGNIEVEVLFK